MLLVEDVISLSGNGSWNEDIFFDNESLCFVADGASGGADIKFRGFHSLAEWFSHSVLEFFNKNYCFDFGFIECLKCSVVHAFEEVGSVVVDNAIAPCLAVASAEYNGGIVTLRFLSDCTAIVKMKNGNVKRYTDNRVLKFSALTLQEHQRARLDGGKSKNGVVFQMIKNKEMLNKKYGYWAITLDNNFYDEFVKVDICAKDIDSLILCTDGFYRICNEFGLMHYSDMFSCGMSLADMAREVRSYELRFANDKNFPCVKVHDDLTAIKLSVV